MGGKVEWVMKRKKGIWCRMTRHDRLERQAAKESPNTTGPLGLEGGGDREMGTADGYVGACVQCRPGESQEGAAVGRSG